MRIMLATLFGVVFSLNSFAQCTTGCDRTDPGDANLTVAIDEVVCITNTTVFGTITVQRGAALSGQKGGELRVCGVGTVLEATASFSIYNDQAPWWDGGVLKLFNCAKVIQSGSFSDNYDVGIEAYCNDCGTADYPLDSAIQVTGSKVLTGWNCVTVLPVELIDFSVYNDEGDVSLVWTTASEVENDYFNVQVSEDGVTWRTIATLQGAGNSQETNTYSAFDGEEKSDIRYYRLEQVDFDGTQHYSDVKVVRFNGSEFFQVYQQNDKIQVELDQEGETRVVIYDVTGKSVRGTNFQNATKSGLTRLSFEKDGLSAGVYTVSIYSGGKVQSKKFLISQ